MPSTTIYEFSDVVLVPFPFTDQSASKQRPAVIVSSAAYHRERLDLILLAITSQTRNSGFAGEAPVARWRDAGLLKPSVFKPVLATVERRLLRRKLGRLSEDDCGKLQRVLAVILGE